jgi:hypothetical protein
MPDEFLKAFARLDSAKNADDRARKTTSQEGEPLTKMRNTRQGLCVASSVPRLAEHF